MLNEVIEAEVDIECNRKWLFFPLQKVLRGRILLSRIKEKGALALVDEGVPDDFPGQRIRLDLNASTGWIIEPIHDNPICLQYVKRRELRLEPPITEFSGVNSQEWLYWLKLGIKCKKLRPITGKLPEKISYRPPYDYMKSTLTGDDLLYEVLRKYPTVAMDYLKLTEEQRTEYRKAIGAFEDQKTEYRHPIGV